MILAAGTQVDVTSPGAPVIAMQPPSPQTQIVVPIGPAGPPGADGGSDAETADRVTDGPLTGAAIAAKIGSLAVVATDEDGDPISGTQARIIFNSAGDPLNIVLEEI